jgi:hypothetical protein
MANRPKKNQGTGQHQEHRPNPEKLEIHGLENKATEALEASQPADPSQTWHWPGKPPKEKHSARTPKVEPDTMPGDTEVQSKTIWQKY